MVVRRRSLRLREPLQTSYGTVAERELLIVAITDEDGVSGYGEAAPLEAYDGVSIARVAAALERYRPVIEARDRHERRGNRRRLPPRGGLAGGVRGDRPGALGPRGAAHGQADCLARDRHAGADGPCQRDLVGHSTARVRPCRPSSPSNRTSDA